MQEIYQNRKHRNYPTSLTIVGSIEVLERNIEGEVSEHIHF